MHDLSVLIPARNEMFLRRTVEDVLAHMRGDTEIIVVLDGEWADPPLEMHDRVTVIHHPKSIGQRGATNEAARVSRAHYIMKLDAHCSVAEGFDVALIEAAKELGKDVTQIPAQYNFHVFNWVCPQGHSRYQGRQRLCEKIVDPATKKKCGAEMTREMVWRPRKSRFTVSWRFDSVLHFQYWGQLGKRQTGDLIETMSCLGACWFLSRERFWELDGLDEGHGGWGQMGTEIALKAWLSGGRLICNKRTWYAHMFRTQGGDFGFPYFLSKDATNKAVAYSKDFWLNERWPKAKRPFRWIIEHFAPVPDWKEGADGTVRVVEQKAEVGGLQARPEPGGAGEPAPDQGASRAAIVEACVRQAPVEGVPRAAPLVDSSAAKESAGPLGSLLTKGVVYYSDCQGDEIILQAAREQLLRATNGDALISVTLAPVDYGDIRIVFANRQRSILTMFKQILAGLTLSEADVVFLAEHDVLYHSSHFQFVPPKSDVYYYNENTWKVDATDGKALFYHCRQTSGLCAYRELLLKHYQRRVALVEEQGFTRRMGFEPGTHNRAERVDDVKSEAWMSAVPNIDIRHGHNLTPNRWHPSQFRNPSSCRGWTEADEVPGWGRTKGRFAEFLKETVL